MHDEVDVQIRLRVHEVSDAEAQVLELRAPAFAAMYGHKRPPGAFRTPGAIDRVSAHGVDHGVAHDDDRRGVDRLAQQRVSRASRRGEVHRGDGAHQTAVRLLRKRPRKVPGAESGLDMSYGQPAIEACEGARQHRRRVSLHDHDVRPGLLDPGVDPRDRARQQLAGVRRHDSEVPVDRQTELCAQLLRETAMLAGEQYSCVDIGMTLSKRPDDRRQLDDLRARAHDDRYPHDDLIFPRPPTLAPRSRPRRSRASSPAGARPVGSSSTPGFPSIPAA